MFFGCISYDGPVCFIQVDGNINADRYQEIVQSESITFFDQVSLREKGYVFQQDGASCHTAKSTKKFFHLLNVKLLNWPSKSPDLNVIL